MTRDPAILESTAGKYAQHRFIVTLTAATPLFQFDEQGAAYLPEEIAPGLLSTFTHEYLHYLHNVSTAEGVGDFVALVTLMGHISELIGDDLEIRGSLEEADLLEYRKAAQLITTRRGDVRLANFLGMGTPTIEILDIRRPKESPVLEVDVKSQSPTGLVQSGEYRFGVLALVEGIAYELDRLVALGPNGDGDGDDNAPPFPYLALRYVGVALAGPIHRVVLVALGILALQTPRSPHRFAELCDLFRDSIEGGEGEADVLKRLVEETAEERQEATASLRPALAAVEEMLADRGALSVGVRFVLDAIEKAIEYRERSSLFELEPFTANRLDPAVLQGLFASLLPCDVIQEREPDGQEPRDALVSFGRGAERIGPFSYSQGVRTLDAAMKYAYHHLGEDGPLPTASAGPLECPFFSCCDLPYRSKHEAECGKRPWALHQRYPKHSCWFTAGVLGIRGEYEVVEIVERTTSEVGSGRD